VCGPSTREPESIKGLSVTLSVETLLCPYGIAYRRVSGRGTTRAEDAQGTPILDRLRMVMDERKAPLSEMIEVCIRDAITLWSLINGRLHRTCTGHGVPSATNPRVLLHYFE